MYRYHGKHKYRQFLLSIQQISSFTLLLFEKVPHSLVIRQVLGLLILCPVEGREETEDRVLLDLPDFSVS